MTTYSSRILTGTNDAHDSNDGFPGSQNTATNVYIGPTAASEVMHSGWIHEDVNITAGATINSATLTVYRIGFDSSGNEVLDSPGIVCLESGTPTTFGTATDSPYDQYTAGPVTTTTVSWTMGADGGDNDPEVSPDIAALIQEALDDSGGDLTDLETLVVDTGAGASVCSAYAFENATSGRSALLDIDWTAGAGGPAFTGYMTLVGVGS